ncbi:MAG: hypothetical protein H0T42_23575 [Deltaproteobacteria bacterium]|nr:hypothetical protein [Deltaproteobacteria bacterium]
MQPITRETLTDRRQPAIRWSAVLGGAALAVGLWGVLQILGVGLALTALDPDDAGSARGVAYGAGIWSMLAPLIAMFAGGYLAAKLANTYDRRIATAHAAVMWGVTAIAGLVFTLWMVSQAALGAAKASEQMGDRKDVAQAVIVSDAHTEAREALVPINNRLRLAGKPQISADQLVGAIRSSTDDGEIDREDFEKDLAKQTALSKDEAAAVATELGPRTNTIATRASRSTPQEHDAMNAAENAGKGLLALGMAILLGIGTSILGALLAMRRYDRKDDDRGSRVTRDIRDGETVRTEPVHTTAPYPVTPPTMPGV